MRSAEAAVLEGRPIGGRHRLDGAIEDPVAAEDVPMGVAEGGRIDHVDGRVRGRHRSVNPCAIGAIGPQRSGWFGPSDEADLRGRRSSV